MNNFTIRDIENLCGIKAHTLRVWEQRYSTLISPKRKPSLHRRYDNEDLKYFLRISFLYHSGHKISKIAQLSEEEICQLAMRIFAGPGAEHHFIMQLAEASIDFDQEKFDRIFHHAILHFGFENAIAQVAFPFLRKIGMLWLTGHVVPAQEHFSSSLIVKKIHIAINELGSSVAAVGGEANTLLLFSPAGELHEIPLLFMHYLLKKNGKRVVYFGANTAIETLKNYCAQKKVEQLVCHLLINLIRCDTDDYISQLLNGFPEQEIIVSGQILQQTRIVNPRLRILNGLAESIEFAESK